MPTVLAKEFGPNNSDLQFEIKNGEVIFDAIEAQGFKLPHGCLSGSCGACRIEIIKGNENLKAPSAVESDTINFLKENLASKNNDPSYLNKNIRLSCRAIINGDIIFSKLK